MNDLALYNATVPVFRHYLARTKQLLVTLPENEQLKLDQRLVDTAFTAAEHIEVSVGFVYRTVRPLMGQAMPEFEDETSSVATLVDKVQEASNWLQTVTPREFGGASRQIVNHTAGSAKLRHDAITYVTLFAMPNYFFHVSQGYAILRANGVDIGKADYDGLHEYASGFHF